MLFRQLFDAGSSTFTYLLADEGTREAVIIDPVFEQHGRDAALVEELGLKLVAVLDTHVHADHVTGAWLLRDRFGARIVLSAHGGARGADALVDDGDRIAFGARHLEVRATPGHTSGCVTYVTDDRKLAFTGDALLVRAAGRTDFQEGDARTLYRSVHEKLFTLPGETLVYPAHDDLGRTCTSIAEERALNPRLGGDRSEDDFALFMASLGLPRPKQLDVAVPANLECGRPRADHPAPIAPDWAPVARTYAGVPELAPEWVAAHAGDVRVVDVREPDEFSGELGHVESAELVPLASLAERAQAWERATPVVTVCRAGGRSAQAALVLEKAGFRRVASLAGGMIRWRHAGLPVAGGGH